MARHPPVSFTVEMTAAPTFDGADQLARAYPFAAGFPLRERLDAAAGMFAAFHERRFPTARERRERLDLLEREVRAVRRGEDRRGEALARLLVAGGSTGLPGADEEIERALSMAPPFEYQFRPEYLDALLTHIAAERAGLRRKRPPVSGDGALRVLVLDLAAIWEDGTGTPASATWDEISGMHGDAVRFMGEVCELLGLRSRDDAPISNEALRHLLRRGRATTQDASRK
jgi:hypothetical protein